MERLIYQKFVDWKSHSGRKPLVLNGARQVGKTWLLHEFARREYRQEAYVNCRRNDLAKQLFAQDFNMERILRALRALTGVDITPDDTLIVLDEIQDSRDQGQYAVYEPERCRNGKDRVCQETLQQCIDKQSTLPGDNGL